MSLSGLKMVSAPASQSDPQEPTEFQPELDTSIETKTIELPSDANASMFTPPPSFKLPDSYKAAQTSFSQTSNQSQANNSNYENHVFDLNESSQETFNTVRPMQQAQGGNAFTPVVKLSNPKILAQLKNTYLLGEDDEGLFIVDQHVAHERVLFDQFVKTYRDKPLTAQPLLFPVPLKLLPSERLIIKEQLNEIKALGFSVQQEEDGLFYVTTIPVSDKKTNDTQSIQNLLSEVLNGWEGRSLAEIKTDLLKTMACKAAVKAGDPLTPSEWTSLLNQLLKTDNPFTCPHGRPIVLRLTTRQIEVGFLRA